MKYQDSFGNTLPKGVFYDPDRRRYRVRTYRHSRVVWCTYHRDYEAAIAAHDHAVRARQNEIDSESNIVTPDRFAEALRPRMATG